MLSYRHSFHAGNFADVLKHTIMVAILNHLLKKDKPFCYFDTHSGCGAYSLHSSEALKIKEFENGIMQLWERSDLPLPIQNYVDQVVAFNGKKSLTVYPGSPSIAGQMKRQNDRMFLFELHPNEFINMRANFCDVRQTKIDNTDGLAGLIANMPPKERRGFVLIDPSYENQSDYQSVVDTIQKSIKRFATGTYALWYPVVYRRTIKNLQRNILKTGIRNIQLFELGVGADSDEVGMTSSGMIVINPPWTLKNEMQLALPFLSKQLGVNGKGFYRIETLVAQ
ncbi:MAG: 23S rRNA (adenine(2030)-N(6))-methyltransferase RlmJ [Psychromonas sp.]|nr:23S rRNA (adenine(2030)-N(6))-methyltransferase RlmJ [Psychromonas sp.]